jgi:histidine triad (HIT) family protein
MPKFVEDCVFCKVITGKVPAEKINECDSFIAILDARPVTKGHTLVIPKKHLVTLFDIPNKLGNELLQFTKNVAYDLMDKKLGDGFNLIMNNLGVAGQVVMHAHIHVIPRNEDDGIRFFTKI